MYDAISTYELDFDYVGDSIVHYRSATIGGVLYPWRFFEVQSNHMGMIAMDYSEFLSIINYQGGI